MHQSVYGIMEFVDDSIITHILRIAHTKYAISSSVG